MKSTRNINKDQKLCLTDLFKLFFACSIWRILKYCLNHILECYLTRIFESFQGVIQNTSIYINNDQYTCCNFYFLKSFYKFQGYHSSVSEKTESTILLRKDFANKMGIFLDFKRLFLAQYCFSVIIIHVQFCKHFQYTQPRKREFIE